MAETGMSLLQTTHWAVPPCMHASHGIPWNPAARIEPNSKLRPDMRHERALNRLDDRHRRKQYTSHCSTSGTIQTCVQHDDASDLVMKMVARPQSPLLNIHACLRWWPPSPHSSTKRNDFCSGKICMPSAGLLVNTPQGAQRRPTPLKCKRLCRRAPHNLSLIHISEPTRPY